MPDLSDVFMSISSDNRILHGLVSGLIITLFNSLGAFAVLFWPNPSQKFWIRSWDSLLA